MNGRMRTTIEDLVMRVRSALDSGRGAAGTAPPPDGDAPSGAPPAPAVDDSIVRRVSPGADRIALFAERAQAVGMEVERTPRSGVAAVVARILRDAGASKAALAVAGDLGADIRSALVRDGIASGDEADRPPVAACYEADAAVTDVHAAIAETGTLVCHTDALHARAHSLVPPVHLAVVRASDIVPDLLDQMRAMRGRPADLPSAQILITGPSKTADIEGILITGVHGPGRVIVVLVEDA